MAEWRNGKMAEWQNGGMKKWRNGEMAEWRNGGMAEWRNGGMAEWRNGRMAEWHNVRYKIVRNQDTESTQMPPWQSPSWLVLSNNSMIPELYLMSIPVLDRKSAPKMTFYLHCPSKTNAFCFSTTQFLSNSGSLIFLVNTIYFCRTLSGECVDLALISYCAWFTMSREKFATDQG
jgi:hypothetical protein